MALNSDLLNARRSGSSPDALVTAAIAEPSNLIPFLATDSASAELAKLIFNGLVKYDKNLNLVGDLAQSFEVSPDGLTIVFDLRKNVRWQDGAPFTAEDVKFTFDQVTNPSVPTPYSSNFEKVKSVRVVDAYTLEVVYKEPFSPGLASWGMGIVPKHLLEKENITNTSFSRKPIGTGPYKLKRWVSGQAIYLEANPDYFEGEPGITQYIYRIIPDQTTLYLELAAGNLDMASLTPLQYTKQTDSDFFKVNFDKYRVSSFAYAYLGYNLKNPLFRDRQVRKALGMAIDKKEIIQLALQGMGQESTGPFLPDSWAYNPDAGQGKFDPAEAFEILKRLGWKDVDGDGILEKDGLRFEFTVLTNQGNEQRKIACEIIQKRFRDVGVQMNIRIIEWGTFIREFIHQKKFDAVLMAWHLSLDPDIYEIFHSSRTAPGEFNFVSYKNEEVDRLLEKARTTFDQTIRAESYRRVHELISEDEPYTFLYVAEAMPIVHKRFVNVEAAPIGIGHNFVDWFVPEGRARFEARFLE